MPPEDQMSNGEIGRHLGRIEATLTQGFDEIKRDLDKYVLKSVHEAEMRSVSRLIGGVEKSLTDAQGRQRWAIGFAVSSLLSVLGLAVAIWNITT